MSQVNVPETDASPAKQDLRPDEPEATRPPEEVPPPAEETVPSAPTEAAEEAPEEAREITPEEQIADLQAQLREAEDRFLRARADLENFRKRAAAEREVALRRKEEYLLEHILRVADMLEQALQYERAAEVNGRAILQGVRMAYDQMLSSLEGLGVRSIEAVGRPFDPQWHEAVEVVENVPPDTPPGTVVAEVTRGYRRGDHLLRAARVKVAPSPPPVPTETPADTAEPATAEEERSPTEAHPEERPGDAPA